MDGARSSARRRTGADAVYAVLDAAPGAIVGVDAAGHIDYVGGATEAVFGYAAEELLGRAVEMLVPEESRGFHESLRQDFVGHPRVRRGELEREVSGRRKDGTVFPAEVSLIPLETAEGPWVIVSVADVTPRYRAARRLHALGRAYLTLAEVNQAIVRAQDDRTLFRETCRVMVEQGGYLGARVGTLDDGEVRWVASAGTDLLDLDPTGPLPPPLGEGPAGPDVALPLRRGGRTSAVLVLHSEEPEVFEEMGPLLDSVAENVSFALQRIDSVARLDLLGSQRRRLSQRLIAAQEEERSRIAGDVHDHSVQALSAVDLRLGLLRRRLVGHASALTEEIDEVQETIAGVSAGLRDLLFDLEPADASTPVPDLLREAAEHLLQAGSPDFALEVDSERWDGVRTLSRTDRGQALRIFKEILFRVRSDPSVTHVLVRVVVEPEGTEISVFAEGSESTSRVGGASPAEEDGLGNVRDRAEVSGGWCRLEEAGHDSTVRFWLPHDPAPGESVPRVRR